MNTKTIARFLQRLQTGHLSSRQSPRLRALFSRFSPDLTSSEIEQKMSTSAISTTALHLDELQSYAVRDPEKLRAGQRVIFAHVPPLERPDLASSTTLPYGQELTILEVTEKCFSELHPGYFDLVNEDDLPKLVILYSQTDGKNRYIHAAEAGVIPYGGSTEFYDSSNFLILVDELEAAGITAVLEASPDYAKKLEVYESAVDTSLNDYLDSDD